MSTESRDPDLRGSVPKTTPIGATKGTAAVDGDIAIDSFSYLSFLCDAVRPSLSLDLTPLLAARAAARARSTSRWLPRDILEGRRGKKRERERKEGEEDKEDSSRRKNEEE
jgi:hypothetical protein